MDIPTASHRKVAPTIEIWGITVSRESQENQESQENLMDTTTDH